MHYNRSDNNRLSSYSRETLRQLYRTSNTVSIPQLKYCLNQLDMRVIHTSPLLIHQHSEHDKQLVRISPVLLQQIDTNTP